MRTTIAILFSLTSLLACSQPEKDRVILGDEKIEGILQQVYGKRVAVVGNHTSVIQADLVENPTHLIDTLIARDVNIVKAFAPEHGFRGNLDAGEKIVNTVDLKTGLPIISLYGDKKKPDKNDLKNIDVIIFDIQDVGARFYTYLSTLHYIMEGCAENNIDLIILDRPNPNGHYIDGPVMKKESMSFVGLHPVPIVYGMSIGEYAKMINGENWLNNSYLKATTNNSKCKLTIIEMSGYNRLEKYKLPEKPSPNLPNQKSINLYPSLCFFEQTPISVGRGTNKQFQIIGSSDWEVTNFNFTPKSMKGAKYPKFENILCNGYNLENEKYLSKINLRWLILAYKKEKNKETFFRSGFHRLAGNKELENQIKNQISESEIKKSWEKDLNDFKKIREKYLIYN